MLENANNGNMKGEIRGRGQKKSLRWRFKAPLAKQCSGKTFSNAVISHTRHVSHMTRTLCVDEEIESVLNYCEISF